MGLQKMIFKVTQLPQLLQSPKKKGFKVTQSLHPCKNDGFGVKNCKNLKGIK
jgi:hypothetical protein